MQRIVLLAAALTLGLAIPASASHERPRGIAHLSQTAGELAHATDRLYQEVAYRAARGNKRAELARASLYQLDKRARRFREKLPRYQRDPKRLRRQFERLHYAYEDAARCFAELGFRRGLRRDLRRVEQLVYRVNHRLDRVLVAQARHRHDPRRHDRHHDRRHERRHDRWTGHRADRDHGYGWDVAYGRHWHRGHRSRAYGH